MRARSAPAQQRRSRGGTAGHSLHTGRAGLGCCGTGSEGREQLESDCCLEADGIEGSRRNPAANISTRSREEEFVPKYEVASFYPS